MCTDIPEYVAMNEAIDFGLREDQRSATIKNLLPDISYRFRVRAINDYGIGHEASGGSGKSTFMFNPSKLFLLWSMQQYVIFFSVYSL